MTAGAAPMPAAPVSPPPLIRVRGLCKTYGSGPTTVEALRGVDLDLMPGEVVVLLGASGSGKSTLLNILGGIETATRGDVRYQDHDLVRASDRELTAYRREHVGFVFQFYNLIGSLTARENVEVVTDIAARPMPAERALGMVGLGERMDHFPSQLSGGEQQRVAIARAFAAQPEILFADEPTGNLDAATGTRIVDLLFALNRDRGATLVLVTHDMTLAARCDRVLRLNAGRFDD